MPAAYNNLRQRTNLPNACSTNPINVTTMLEDKARLRWILRDPNRGRSKINEAEVLGLIPRQERAMRKAKTKRCKKMP